MPLPLSPPQFITFSIFAFLLGACIGSYLNVVIYRLPLNISTSNPKRSFCPSCKYQIPFFHNIPLVSWLLLRGKCANCRSAISIRYWFVELITALLFWAVFYHCMVVTGNRWQILPYWILIALFIAGTYIDIDHYILPDEITLGGAVVGLVCSLAVPNFLVDGPWWLNGLHSLGGAALGYGLLWLVVELGKKLFGRKKMEFEKPLPWDISQPEGAEEPIVTIDGDPTPWSELFFRKSDQLHLHCPEAEIDGQKHQNVTLAIRLESVEIRPSAEGAATLPPVHIEQIQRMTGTCDSVIIPREAMGLGDVKFMALVGAFLGWKGVLFTVFAGSVIGCILALLLIATGRREWAQKVPFGPYLALGATLFLFFGAKILTWYFGLRFGGGGLESGG